MSEASTLRDMLNAEQLPPPSWTLNWQGRPMTELKTPSAAPDPSKVQWDGPDPNKVQWDQPAQPATVFGMTGREWAAHAPLFAGGKYAPDIAQGAMEVPLAAAQMVAHIPGLPPSAGNAVDSFARSLEQNYKQNFQAEQMPGASIARGAGQALVAAPITPAMEAAGAVKAALQGAGTGAAAGALTPLTGDTSDFWTQKAKQAGLGAALGGPLSAGLNMAGRVISPQVGPDVRKLLDEGVTPTIGQQAPGPFGIIKSLEDKLTSVPIMGDAIRSAQGAALQDFNRAIYNRILAPIGQTYPKTAPVGQAGIAKVGDTLSDAYNAILPQIGAVDLSAGSAFGQSMGQLRQLAQNMPPERAQQFDNIVNSAVTSRLTPAGTTNGAGMKEMESQLGRYIRQYKGSQDGDQRALADALQQAQANLRSAVANQYPQAAPVVQAVNNGYAQLVQLELGGKGTKVARNEGVLTPADYLRGIQRADTSVRDRATTRGEAMNQDLAQAADRVLSSNVPDSGTTGRAAALAAVGGLLFGNPALGIPAAAGISIGSLPYLPVLRKLATGLLSQRPAAVQGAGNLVQDYAPYAGLLAAPSP